MGKLYLESGWLAMNKAGEQLCGDHVETVNLEDSFIMVLADGLGSGVKASILSTLTAKILSTMLAGEMTVEDCVETIAMTLPVCRQNGQFHAPILHFIEWAQNRIVLHSSGDDMIFRLQDPLDSYVQCFCGVGRKGDPLRAFGVKQLSQSQPGIKDHAVCIQGSLVCSTARVAQAAQGAGYCFHHTVRFMPGGGGIVQINHLATSYTRQRYMP